MVFLLFCLCLFRKFVIKLSMCVYYFIFLCVCRYMIKVRVIDDTDSTTFVIFDRDATLLLKKSAVDMIESMRVTTLVILIYKL